MYTELFASKLETSVSADIDGLSADLARDLLCFGDYGEDDLDRVVSGYSRLIAEFFSQKLRSDPPAIEIISKRDGVRSGGLFIETLNAPNITELTFRYSGEDIQAFDVMLMQYVELVDRTWRLRYGDSYDYSASSISCINRSGSSYVLDVGYLSYFWRNFEQMRCGLDRRIFDIFTPIP